MTTKPGEVYRVDLGAGGKVRMMLVVSREDSNPPRALSLCVPITSAYRDSPYDELRPLDPWGRRPEFALILQFLHCALRGMLKHELRQFEGGWRLRDSIGIQGTASLTCRAWLAGAGGGGKGDGGVRWIDD